LIHFFFFSSSATGSINAWRIVIKQKKEENGFVNFCLYRLYNKDRKSQLKVRLVNKNSKLNKFGLKTKFDTKMVLASARRSRLFSPMIRNKFNFRLWVNSLWFTYFNLTLKKKAMRGFVDMPLPKQSSLNGFMLEDPIWLNYLRNQMFDGLWYSMRRKTYFFRVLQFELGVSGRGIKRRGIMRRYRCAKIFNIYQSFVKELDFNKGVLVALRSDHVSFVPSNLPSFYFTGKVSIKNMKIRQFDSGKLNKQESLMFQANLEKNVKNKKNKQKFLTRSRLLKKKDVLVKAKFLLSNFFKIKKSLGELKKKTKIKDVSVYETESLYEKIYEKKREIVHELKCFKKIRLLNFILVDAYNKVPLLSKKFFYLAWRLSLKFWFLKRVKLSIYNRKGEKKNKVSILSRKFLKHFFLGKVKNNEHKKEGKLSWNPVPHVLKVIKKFSTRKSEQK